MTELPEEIRKALVPGEQVLWWGRPRRGLVLRRSDAFAIPFSLLWCGFAVFWESGVAGSRNAPPFFLLWGAMFVLIGLYLVIGRFFAEAWQRARTAYALTADRVLIVSGIWSRTTQSLALSTLSDLSLTEGGHGRGTITFGPLGLAGAMFGGASSWPGSSRRQSPCFDLIDDAKSVYERIRSAQRAQR